MENKIVNPLVYSTANAAKKIGVSYGTLYRMIKDGKIKAINIAHTGTKPIYSILAEDVDAYLKKRNSLQTASSGDKGFDE